MFHSIHDVRYVTRHCYYYYYHLLPVRYATH